MIDDPIVAEIRKNRNLHAKKYNYDLDKIFLSIKKAEKKHHRLLVNREINNFEKKLDVVV
ncbi:MAG: hypothetical protein DRQ51_02460 [Gammaproteobacteria bacterium]|nr:MAG: hypothetical protein DRQ51_02460 [Gammaproteobacteria bacterium]